MSNEDIAELLTVAFASHCAECEVNGENHISNENFFDAYKDNIQKFRHLMNVDVGDRELNG